MKDFITPEAIEGGSQAETKEKYVKKEGMQNPEVIRELAHEAANKISDTSENIGKLEPQTKEQEERAGFFKNIGNKIKGAFASKELSPQDQLVKDIRDLTHFTTSNAGLGGLGNISGGGFAGLSAIAERYGIPEEKISDIGKLQKEVDDMDNGTEKVTKIKELNTRKLNVTQDMRASIEK